MKYKTEVLLKAKEFAKYQPDFLRALLKKDEYTLQEARTIVNKFFEVTDESYWLVDTGKSRIKSVPAYISGLKPTSLWA